MSKEKPRIIISARDLRDIIRDELYAVQAKLKCEDDLQNGRIKEVAKTIVKRALLSPR
jgi:hypothetical protein